MGCQTITSSHFYFKRGPILHIFRYAPDVSEHWVGIEFSGKFIPWAICLLLLSISNRIQSISPLFLPLSFLIFYQSYMIFKSSFWFISLCILKSLHTTYIHHTYLRNTIISQLITGIKKWWSTIIRNKFNRVNFD